MYSSVAKSEISSANLSGFAFGVSFAFSIAIKAAGGPNIVRTRNILEIAVWVTAIYAHFCDFPYDSSVSLSSTSIPFSISVYLMKYAFKYPAAAHARNELTALSITRRPPDDFLAIGSTIFLTPRLIPMALVVAIA